MEPRYNMLPGASTALVRVATFCASCRFPVAFKVHECTAVIQFTGDKSTELSGRGWIREILFFVSFIPRLCLGVLISPSRLQKQPLQLDLSTSRLVTYRTSTSLTIFLKNQYPKLSQQILNYLIQKSKVLLQPQK